MKVAQIFNKLLSTIVIFSSILLLSHPVILTGCANPTLPSTSDDDTTEEESEESGEENSGDSEESEESSEENSGDSEESEESDEENSGDSEESEESDEENSGDSEESEEIEDVTDPHNHEFYINHPEVSDETIYVGDFWVGNLNVGEQTWFKLKPYNYFSGNRLVRIGMINSSVIIERHLDFGFSITDEIWITPEVSGWNEVIFTIMDVDGNILSNQKYFVNVK